MGAVRSLGLSQVQTQTGKGEEGLTPGMELALGCWHRGRRSSQTEGELSGSRSSHELLFKLSSYCSNARRETPTDQSAYICMYAVPPNLPRSGTPAAPFPSPSTLSRLHVGHSRERAGRSAICTSSWEQALTLDDVRSNCGLDDFVNGRT